MGWLDSVFGGDSSGSNVTYTTQSTSSSPWEPQQQYLKDVFSQAKKAYNSGNPSYFPESTVVGYSPETQKALSQVKDIASGNNPMMEAAQSAVTNTASGSFLNAGNPYMQNAYNNAASMAGEAFRDQTLPSIDSSFASAGRLGSGLYAKQRNKAEDTFARSMSEMAGNMAYQNYQDERGRQMSAASMAPAMSQARYQDAQMLANVGSAREAEQQAELSDRVNRWNFEQNSDWDRLGRYASLISGGYGGQGTQTTPVYTNNAGNFLGSAATGAGIGNMIGGGTGAGYGALAGGLLGML